MAFPIRQLALAACLKELVLSGLIFLVLTPVRAQMQNMNLRNEPVDISDDLLVRDGAAIPHIKLAQSTMQMDWSELELKVFASDSEKAEEMICLPSDNKLENLELYHNGTTFGLKENPLKGKSELKVSWLNNKRVQYKKHIFVKIKAF
ncbi:hypothetical protein [Anaerophaga thermohalophila]|uniref:hypothetical protein n=1 Tax=Anaerophaga thermohalophila TaxID=177400 RepID=UPI000237B929|nr:hypothetical protein [Anaerophaga thermohalophila]